MPPTLSQVLWVSGNAFRLLTVASGVSADFLGMLWDCLGLSGLVWDLPGACPGACSGALGVTFGLPEGS